LAATSTSTVPAPGPTAPGPTAPGPTAPGPSPVRETTLEAKAAAVGSPSKPSAGPGSTKKPAAAPRSPAKYYLDGCVITVKCGSEHCKSRTCKDGGYSTVSKYAAHLFTHPIPQFKVDSEEAATAKAVRDFEAELARTLDAARAAPGAAVDILPLTFISDVKDLTANLTHAGAQQLEKFYVAELRGTLKQFPTYNFDRYTGLSRSELESLADTDEYDRAIEDADPGCTASDPESIHPALIATPTTVTVDDGTSVQVPYINVDHIWECQLVATAMVAVERRDYGGGFTAMQLRYLRDVVLNTEGNFNVTTRAVNATAKAWLIKKFRAMYDMAPERLANDMSADSILALTKVTAAVPILTKLFSPEYVREHSEGFRVADDSGSVCILWQIRDAMKEALMTHFMPALLRPAWPGVYQWRDSEQHTFRQLCRVLADMYCCLWGAPSISST
jgi:hypothetical protein